MAPRSTVLPEAQTESARTLRQNFYCTLCSKGYARITDFENHENSYDHQHRKRAKEMKSITRGPSSIIRKSDRKRDANEGMISMNLKEETKRKGGGEGGRGFRDIGGERQREKEQDVKTEVVGVEVLEEEEDVFKPLRWHELPTLHDKIDSNTLPQEWQQRPNPTEKYLGLFATAERRKQYYKDDEEVLDELGIADEDWVGDAEQGGDVDMDLDDDWEDYMQSDPWKEQKSREAELRKVKVVQGWKQGGPVSV